MFKLLKLWLILAACLVLVQGVRADTFTVVQGTSKYWVGQTLPGKTRLKEIKMGEELIVKNDRDRKEYRITGPYSEDKSKNGLLEMIIKIFGPKREAIDSDLLMYMNNHELIVVSEDKNFCYSSRKPLRFWRSDFEDDVELIIKSGQTDEPLEWKEAQDTLEVPINKLDMDVTYLAEIEESSISISLHQIPFSLTSSTEKARWMIKKGCQRQARLLLLVK